ncbi:MAG: DUF2520 domain-containing protein [Bacteroidetes bacterium]|nr:DUF2520 domain-containing protein [Bacteroidota bacterium]
MKNNIYICGNGNLGSSLLREFEQHRIHVSGIYSRSEPQNLPSSVRWCRYGTDQPARNSIVFITVPDSHIAETESYFLKSGCYTVHTAGAVEINELKNSDRGVFYPLQTFSTGIRVNWIGLPVLIETSDEELLEALFEIVAAFGARGMEADSDQRKAIHLAAVFANNFTNAMYGIAENLSKKAALPQDVLLPLMQQTVRKLEFLHADEAQTGPAKRGDIATIERHMQMLKNDSEYAKIYELLSNYILNHFNKK